MEERIKQMEATISDLQVQLADLTLKLSQRSEFESTFSDRIIINKKVQFMQKVYNAAGTAVIN